MTGHIFGALGLLAVVGAGGTLWLMVRDGRGRSRPSSARALRIATTLSTLVILGTVVFLRPWYWDLAIAVVVVAAWRCFLVLVGAPRAARALPPGGGRSRSPWCRSYSARRS